MHLFMYLLSLRKLHIRSHTIRFLSLNQSPQSMRFFSLLKIKWRLQLRKLSEGQEIARVAANVD